MHYNSAWDLMRSEKYEEAIAEFQEALRLNPKLNMAHYGIGRAQMALHQYDAAIEAYTACRSYILAQEGAKYTGQAEANRVRQDRMMELQDLQRQYSKGPQNTQTADMQRQIQNSMRITQDDTDRGQNISIESSVPAFLSVRARQRVLPRRSPRGRGEGVQGGDCSRFQGGRGAQQSGGALPAQRTLRPGGAVREERREGGLPRQSGTEGSDQEREEVGQGPQAKRPKAKGGTRSQQP